MASSGFDGGDDEFIPFSLRDELKPKKRKTKFNAWLGEEEEDDDDDDARPVFAGLEGIDLGGPGGGMFVAGGGLQKQLPKSEKKEAVTEEERRERAAKRSKKDAAVSVKQGAAKMGIGLSLLQKMGWSGDKGLGKNGTGITQALDVKVRPHGAGLGMIEEKTEGQKKLERQRRGDLADSSSDADDDDDDLNFSGAAGPAGRSQKKKKKPAPPVDRTQRWKKSGAKPRVEMRSAYDVVQEESAGQEPQLTIIDLTRPGERVVTDTRQLYEQERQATDYTGGLGRELRYNVDKLLDMAEVELKRQSRRMAQLEKKTESYSEQVGRLTAAQNAADEQLLQLQQAESLIVRLAEAAPQLAAAADVSNDAAEQLVSKLDSAFTGARKRFGETLYTKLNMPDLLYALVEAPMKLYFARWDFLNDPAHGRDAALALRSLLEMHQVPLAPGQEEKMDFWELFLSMVVTPPLRTWLVREWDCKRQTEQVVLLVNSWTGVWDEHVYHYVVHEVIWQRLVRAVDEWDPFTDDTPLHEWLHPWLLILASRMEQTLYPVIVYKLNAALRDWDPMDGSAHALLYPWRHCFTRQQLEDVGATSIIPKLATLCSNSMSFVPGTQPPPSVLDAVLVWHDWLPETLFLKLLARSVFPLLYRSAYKWCIQSRPAGKDVISWYQQLKSSFPGEIFVSPKVSILFAHLLDVIVNVRVDGNQSFEPEVLLVDLWVDENASTAEASRKRQAAASVPSAASDMMSFRSMVEAFAGERGILFIPVANKTYNGKAVYSFGGINIYLANQLVYAETQPGRYSMVSLEHLAQLVSSQHGLD